jgi:hypothetical protein
MAIAAGAPPIPASATGTSIGAAPGPGDVTLMTACAVPVMAISL